MNILKIVCAVSLTAFLCTNGALGAQLRMSIQVNDVHGKPIPNIGVSIAGHGVSGLRTSRQGSTRLTLPPDVQIADAISVQLDADTASNWVFIQPWDSVVTVPKPKSHTLIVLAHPGDKLILESGPGLMAMLTKIDRNLIEVKKTDKSNNNKLLTALKQTTHEYGFTPQQVQAAAKQRQEVTTDPKEKAIIASYTTDTASLLAALDEIPNYAKKQKMLAQLTTLNNMLMQAISSYALSLPSFETIQSGIQMDPEHSSIGNHIGVRSAVEPQICVWPTIFISIDDEDNVSLKVEEERLMHEPLSQISPKNMYDAIRNYFTPRIQKSATEFRQKLSH